MRAFARSSFTRRPLRTAAVAVAAFGLAAAGLAAAINAQESAEPSAEETVGRAIIGVGVQDDGGPGVRIAYAKRGFPGAEAGLQAGDRIVGFNGEEVVDARGLVAAITERRGATSAYAVSRDGAALFFDVAPWSTPNPELDARFFPYGGAEETDEITRGFSGLTSRIGGRDYAVVMSNRVFDDASLLLSTLSGGDNALSHGRVVFRAKVGTCADLSALERFFSRPGASFSAPLQPITSLLFDFEVAEAERAECEAYFEENGLVFSNPVVYVAGRFYADEAQTYTDLGTVFLVDAVLFDNDHVSFGAQVMSTIRLLGSLGAL